MKIVDTSLEQKLNNLIAIAFRHRKKEGICLFLKGENYRIELDKTLNYWFFDYDIVDSTPYKKDVLKLLAEECHKQGIKLFFYYSLLDWNRDDYFPRGRTGKGIEGRKEGKWENQ